MAADRFPVTQTKTGPPEGPSRYLSASAVAKKFDVSNETVRRWIKQGRLRAFRLNERTVRIPEEDVLALLKRIQPDK